MIEIRGKELLFKNIDKIKEKFPKETDAAVQRVALRVEAHAVDNITNGGIPFVPLAESTFAWKMRNRYSPMPLIRTGEMLRSIHSWKIAECEAGVGTPDEKAPYHEFGTATIPKRAFLYPALAQSIEEAKDEFKKLEDALYG